ncbi:hypothetical protein CEXT_286251 [Caerostris extrusa]|uniref:Uncharacterized protein n=1 Tax=Caerostris extrusa TaxID=172846 RepID=A0AAV4N7D3_CAEEX|nr:hypothetical protein CEXT_286251 [Caerostris extrusa]
MPPHRTADSKLKPPVYRERTGRGEGDKLIQYFMRLDNAGFLCLNARSYLRRENQIGSETNNCTGDSAAFHKYRQRYAVLRYDEEWFSLSSGVCGNKVITALRMLAIPVMNGMGVLSHVDAVLKHVGIWAVSRD